MKKVFVVHAWGENPQSCWYPWLKAELENRGFKMSVIEMPETDAPAMRPWINALSKVVTEPDEETYLVGHSIGCQTILRYLAGVPEGQKVGGAVFVAPWTTLTNLSEASVQIAKPWVETPINWDAAKAHCSNFSAFFSDDDQWVPISEEGLFQKKLGAKTKLLHSLGHFDDATELPELLEDILRMVDGMEQ